jgi:hypothetical protein
MPSLQFDTCPNCKGTDIKRSHRRNLTERILSIAVLPYRCEACNVRFFIPRWMAPLETAKEKSKAAGA